MCLYPEWIVVLFGLKILGAKARLYYMVVGALVKTSLYCQSLTNVYKYLLESSVVFVVIYIYVYFTLKVAQKSITNKKTKVTGQGQEVCTSTYSHN